MFHKENTGVSDSRNLAIREARGSWLQFVDADDWISPEATGLLAAAMDTQDCDMVISDFYRVIDNRIAHKGDIQEEGLLSKKEFASCMMEKPADYYYGVSRQTFYNFFETKNDILCSCIQQCYTKMMNSLKEKSPLTLSGITKSLSDTFQEDHRLIQLMICQRLDGLLEQELAVFIRIFAEQLNPPHRRPLV